MPDDFGFWDGLMKTAYVGGQKSPSVTQFLSDAVDDHLQGASIHDSEGKFTSVQALTDRGRSEYALNLPVKAGTRVRFHANTGSVFSYADPPEHNTEGVVVSVRSASGEVTDYNGMVFVEWDGGGETQQIYAEHLRLATGHRRRGSMNRIRVASLGDLSDFLKVAEDTLVHKATRDLWSVKKDGNDFVIERLFDDTGKPLRV